MEEIQVPEDETSDEEFENEDQTLIISDVGELLVIQRALHVKEVPFEPSQREQSSVLGVSLEIRCVNSSLMVEVTSIWLH